MKDKIFNALQLIGGMIMCVGYIPQIIQILQTQLVRDLNLTMNLMVFIGVLFMECYAIYLVKDKKSGHAFLITNSISTILATVMLLLIIIYK